MSILYTLEEELTFPFRAKVLGDTVEVIGIDDRKSSFGRGMIARIRKKGKEYNIGLAELEIDTGSGNSKWFEMYHHWISRY